LTLPCTPPAALPLIPHLDQSREPGPG
jgi:hypothetical protein